MSHSPRRISRRHGFGRLAILAAACWHTAPALADVGAVMAVVPQAETGQAGQMRRVDLGDRVVMGQAFRTDAVGLAQVTFVDGSSFTIGPNSELVIDRFIYDPDKGTAELAATATRGVFRFIGGAASKGEDGAVISTPVGTAGIRGAQLMFTISPDRGLQLIMDYGRDTIFRPATSGAPPQTVLPGMIFAARPDGSTSTSTDPATIDAAAAALLSALQSPPAGPNSPSPQALSFGLATARAAAGTGAGGSFDAGLPFAPFNATGPNGPATSSSGQDQASQSRDQSIADMVDRLNAAQQPRNDDRPPTSPPTRPPEPPAPPPPPPPPRLLDGIRQGFASATPETQDIRRGEITLSFDASIPSVGAELNFGSTSAGFAPSEGEYVSPEDFGSARGNTEGIELRAYDPAALCQCDYLQWGGWLGDTSDPLSETADMRGYWVAGELSDLSSMPLPASASYNGTAMGVVRQNGRMYETSSPFSATADFASGEIETRMSNFFGADLEGSGSISNSGQIEGSFSSALNTDIAGSFIGGFTSDLAIGGDDPIAGVIGSFTVTDDINDWAGAGIFAGSRVP